jgi:hypothetical protein
MAGTQVPAYVATTSAQTLIAAGTLTFSSAAVAANFIVGALCWLRDSSALNPVCVIVTAVVGANVSVAFQPFNSNAGQVAIKGITNAGAGISFTGNYGTSNLSSPVSYGTGSTLSQYIQVSSYPGE